MSWRRRAEDDVDDDGEKDEMCVCVCVCVCVWPRKCARTFRARGPKQSERTHALTHAHGCFGHKQRETRASGVGIVCARQSRARTRGRAQRFVQVSAEKQRRRWGLSGGARSSSSGGRIGFLVRRRRCSCQAAAWQQQQQRQQHQAAMSLSFDSSSSFSSGRTQPTASSPVGRRFPLPSAGDRSSEPRVQQHCWLEA